MIQSALATKKQEQHLYVGGGPLTYEYCGRKEMEEKESQQRGWNAQDSTNRPKNIKLNNMEYFSTRPRRVVTGVRIPVDTFVTFVLAAVTGTDGKALAPAAVLQAAALKDALREMRAIFFRWFSCRDVESSVDEMDFIDVVR